MDIDFQIVGVVAAIFFSAFTQAVTGFGSALVGIPLLSQITGVKVAAPLLALLSIPMNVTLLVLERRAFEWRAVWRLIAAALVAIPLGIFAVSALGERIVLGGLGVVLIGYALYAWFAPRLPELKHPLWSYVFGAASGLLAGSYSVGGPPVVIYAACKRWEPDEFRGNLQAVFLIENVVVIAGHVSQGDYTPQVLGLLWYGVPALIIGIGLGIVLDRFIPDALFRKLVLILLVGLGVRLLFP